MDPNEQEYIKKSTMRNYIVVMSIVFLLITIGMSIVFGGITGAVVSKFFPSQSISTQSVKVTNEESAVISAVKKANSAVVSVIISQQVPNISNNYNPLDPFGMLNGGSPGGTGSTQQTVGAGSGMIISSDGYILTNKHVASDPTSTYTVILTDGRQITGKIVAQDPTNDIAILKIDASNLPTVSIGSSANLQLGQTVVAIGNALGQYANTVSKGVVSGVNRVVTASDSSSAASETLHNVLQTDAQINPGNSGGPLLDINGNVIGINTAIAQNAQGIGFAIPIDQAKTDIAAVEKTGKIVKPQFGVRYEQVDAAFKAANPSITIPYTYGAYVTDGSTATEPAVLSGSPADKAGIQKGDVLLEVNGTKIDDTNTLSELIQQHAVGDTVQIKYYRNRQENTVSVKLDKAF